MFKTKTKVTMIKLVFILNAISLLKCQEVPDCTRTVWGGPSGPGKDCVFPFILNGKRYTMCTTATEGNQRPWCPTKLDRNGRVDIISNDFGYCDPNCRFDNGRNVVQTTTTTSKPLITTTTRRTTRRPRPQVTTPRTTTNKPISSGIW